MDQEKSLQACVAFPDWRGYTDDTLALNGMYSFYGCHGQGRLRVGTAEGVESFRMFVNGIPVDTSRMKGGSICSLDIAGLARNGENTLQVSGIRPPGLSAAVRVSIPFPVVLPGTPEEEGISPRALQMISEIIRHDVEKGFPGAQLAVVRNGRLVCEKAWGHIDSSNPESPPVTADTLFDLASVTKMFSVNYALQKLVSDGVLDLDAKVTDFLGARFLEEPLPVPDAWGEHADAPPETILAWKADLTIRDLLCHWAGFPADPRYASPFLGKDPCPEEGKRMPNPFFAGCGADAGTRERVVSMICRTPLIYAPRTKTVYSDVDYMLLGLIVEQVTGTDLNTWLKKTFWEPMGLRRITYNPLQNGFSKEDCAATEPGGNTRGGVFSFPGYRTRTLQGEVHDEKAYYCMAGISGHAGLFANASDLARLASVMLSGGYGEHRFFSGSVLQQFTAPCGNGRTDWGLGWWRQGEGERPWYFGTQAGPETIGHQGWTGTLVMIDPGRNLVIAYLTNKLNTAVTDPFTDPDRFNGSWFTASTLGFVPQILSAGIGAADEAALAAQLTALAADMAAGSLKRIPEGKFVTGDHPAVRNAESKIALFREMAEELPDREEAAYLSGAVREAAAEAGRRLPESAASALLEAFSKGSAC